MLLCNFDTLYALRDLMITINFNTETKILENNLSGTITIADVLNMYHQIEHHGSLPANLKIIIDSQKARYSFTEKDLQKIANAIKHLLTKFNSIQEAIIQSTPYETAMAVLYEQIVQIENFQFKVFSSYEAAIQWLKN